MESPTAPRRGAARARPALLLLLALALALAAAAGIHALVGRGPAERSAPVERSSPLPADAPQRLLDRLVARHGPKRYSQHHEELIIRDVLGDRRGGVFVDVGAGHYRTDSTTYYLERHLGWRGVAVDAQEEYRADYERHRPATRFFAFFVADRSEREALLHIGADRRYASGDRAQAATPGAAPGAARVVRTITLDDLLARAGITSIDFLSMDIELAEPAALAGLSIERFRPALVCIEAHPRVRPAIEAYFARRGYVRLLRYAGIDRLNHYYVPRRARE